jgi:hypothetical protein
MTTVPIAKGVEAYTADVAPVTARGYALSQGDLDAARKGRLPAIAADEAGRAGLAAIYAGLELTDFGSENVKAALEAIPEEDHSKGWREGESIAEAWLTDHCDCEFPWPMTRDLRHHRASLPGAEFLGFVGKVEADTRFAFGQVKTSKEVKRPPQVMNNGPKNLVNQILQLRDDALIKKTVVGYLGARATSASAWLGKFQAAARRYFNSGALEIAIFGVLIRDVPPDAADLAGPAASVGVGCTTATRVELVALYLPAGAIPEGPQHRARKAKKAKK